MTEKIDIAEILKDKPANTKLYSPLFGEVYFSHVGSGNIAVEHHGGISLFFSSCRFFNYDESEPLLFPSKEMRDWRKFAWKKGDVLVSNDGKIEVIFEKFGSDTYQSFIGKHHLDSLDENLYYQDGGAYPTASFNIETEDAAQTYINTIEERLDGKLNHETLEIEKTLPEFKDGDILSIQEDEEHYHTIFIFKGGTDVYVYFDYFHRVLTYGTKIDENEKSISHIATVSEKQKLFDALAKEGKAWDADKKMIIDLKKKVELKPFDKVVVRCSEVDRWSIDFFSYKAPNGYICTGDAWFGYCLPYNEETAKLIGTTKDMEG